MAQRGGARPGAGRPSKKIVIDTKAKLAEAVSLLGTDLSPEQVRAMSPIDVMLHAMKLEAIAANWKAAAALAEKAAPYLHPKLSSETLNVRNDDSQRSEADIQRELDDLDQRAAASASQGTPPPGVPPEPAGILH